MLCNERGCVHKGYEKSINTVPFGSRLTRVRIRIDNYLIFIFRFKRHGASAFSDGFCSNVLVEMARHKCIYEAFLARFSKGLRPLTQCILRCFKTPKLTPHMESEGQREGERGGEKRGGGRKENHIKRFSCLRLQS